MNDEIDIKFNIITECTNRILGFQADLKKETDLSKIEFLTFSIEEQKKLIEGYTNSSADFVLRYVEKINASKQKLSEEQDPEKRKMLGNTISTYTDMIKSNINDKTLSEENISDKTTNADEKTADKFIQYRSSQKCDPELLKHSKDVTTICEEHQTELKSQEDRTKMDERE